MSTEAATMQDWATGMSLCELWMLADELNQSYRLALAAYLDARHRGDVPAAADALADYAGIGQLLGVLVDELAWRRQTRWVTPRLPSELS